MTTARPLLLIDRGVLERMQSTARSNAFRHEVGGVLLGSRRGPHLHIRDLTTPQKGDRSSPVRFWRSPVGHQELAKAAWRRSDGQIGYLGEWHSHPQRDPRPSFLDRSSWRTTVTTHRTSLAFVIIGMEGVWASVEPGGERAWTVLEADEASLLYAQGDKA